MLKRSLGTVGVLVCCASGAQAQTRTPSPIGITMGYPASVGVLWNVSDAIALRPSLSFEGESANESSVLTSRSRNLTFGVDALVYLRKYDHLRTYFAPHLDYSHGSDTTQPTAAQLPTVTATSSAVGVAGSFGAQYALTDHFGLFGEAGFGFSHSSISSSQPVGGSGNAWGTRAGVGVIFWP